MSRQLPLCAWCGESLKRKGRMLAHYGELRGTPDIGWHTEKCMTADTICKPMTGDGEKIISEIRKRGKCRVIRFDVTG